MVMQAPQEYKDFLNSRLNPFERFSDLLTGRDDRQDFIIIELWEMLKLLAQGIPGGGGGDGGGTPGISPLTTRSVGLIRAVAVRSTDLVYPSEMADCRAAHRVLVHVSNALDQSVRITVIGHVASNYSGASVLHELTCPAGERRTYGLKLEEWTPYVGVQAQAWTAPTAGNLDAVAIVQE